MPQALAKVQSDVGETLSGRVKAVLEHGVDEVVAAKVTESHAELRTMMQTAGEVTASELKILENKVKEVEDKATAMGSAGAGCPCVSGRCPCKCNTAAAGDDPFVKACPWGGAAGHESYDIATPDGTM
jgi:hypothetical protein